MGFSPEQKPSVTILKGWEWGKRRYPASGRVLWTPPDQVTCRWAEPIARIFARSVV